MAEPIPRGTHAVPPIGVLPDDVPLMDEVGQSYYHLNACEDAGYKVVLTGWQAIHTKRGYVLRLKDRRWAARTQDYEPFPVTAGDDVLDDGMDE